jgi:hypothetical protein
MTTPLDTDQAAPRPRKPRRPTHLGTCQICGKLFVVTETVTPPVIRPHGYDTYKAHKGMRIPCGGAGQPPLEFESAHAARTLRFCKSQLADLLERRVAIEAGTGPPPGLTGINALKVRFSGATQIAEEQRQRDSNTARIRIEGLNRDINLMTRLIATRAVAPTTLVTVANLRRGGLPRIGDIFRKNADGRLYTVESTEPAPSISYHGTRRPIKAPHYMCRRTSDGTLHRFLQNTITRALKNQGGSLPPIGRPPE